MILALIRAYSADIVALWIDKHELFGLATRMSVIIPTSARFTDTARVDDLIWDDIKRIDIFIAAANELIEDPQLRQEAGFDYERFTPQVIPQREVIMPTFDKEEFYVSVVSHQSLNC